MEGDRYKPLFVGGYIRCAIRIAMGYGIVDSVPAWSVSAF